MGMFEWHALTCLGPYLEAVVSVSYDGFKFPSSRDALPVNIGAYDMAPVSTLRHVFGVAQRNHQLVEELGDSCKRVLDQE